MTAAYNSRQSRKPTQAAVSQAVAAGSTASATMSAGSRIVEQSNQSERQGGQEDIR
ncbi:hypothetical protein [Mycobacterium lepromatosis]|uniref:hypothetical protein n=1 Tax=Mycobacterium lepromatosis TaxID=480418 RepID=UPI0012E01672|nr:hypothetical protein [Mycobacterium lepromatosis]